MGGLALLLSKSKPSKEEDDLDTEKGDAEGDAEGEKEAGLEDEFLGDAFDALKSGNKEAFIGAMKSCLEK